MALLEEWHKIAYNDKADQGELQRFWQHYFLLEKGVYEKLLANPDEAVEGTVKELAEKYELSIMELGRGVSLFWGIIGGWGESPTPPLKLPFLVCFFVCSLVLFLVLTCKESFQFD